MAKLLLIEDNNSLSFVIKSCLETDSHIVDCVRTGQEAWAALRTYTYDLLVLDWNLPDLSGLEICSKYRGIGGKAPILMLTANETSSDKVTAFDTGVDDYVAKPFDPPELRARVRALLRRPNMLVENNVKTGKFELDKTALQLRRGNESTALTQTEFALLELLMRHPNQNFTPESIIHRLWASEVGCSPDTVRSHIKNLRKKLGDADGKIIRLTRGLGYRFQDGA